MNEGKRFFFKSGELDAAVSNEYIDKFEFVVLCSWGFILAGGGWRYCMCRLIPDTRRCHFA